MVKKVARAIMPTFETETSPVSGVWDNFGYTLIEVLIVLSIIAVATTGIVFGTINDPTETDLQTYTQDIDTFIQSRRQLAETHSTTAHVSLYELKQKLIESHVSRGRSHKLSLAFVPLDHWSKPHEIAIYPNGRTSEGILYITHNSMTRTMHLNTVSGHFE